jgi:predicted ATPase
MDSRWNVLEPLMRRRAIIDAVRNAIDKVIATRPTILLLEDLHWIDGQSETAIEALMSLTAGYPLLVLLTWRTEDTPGWLARLDVRRIWLRSDISSANALLDDLLGAGPGLDALKGHIFRHTGQVPLFIEEVARQLLNRGVLEADAGRFAAKTSRHALDVPPTVQGVIASRIDRLPKEDKALLQLASVVGPHIPPPLLTALQAHLWSLEILDFEALTAFAEAGVLTRQGASAAAGAIKGHIGPLISRDGPEVRGAGRSLQVLDL